MHSLSLLWKPSCYSLCFHHYFKTSIMNPIDKYVRENDENWTSKQSAACVKSGDGISTFRDKYGEN